MRVLGTFAGEHTGYVGAMADTAIFDLDGTLVDSNYQHAIAWYRAFREHGYSPPIWRIHRAIGMGGDHLVGAVCGAGAEAAHGDEIRATWAAEFDTIIGEVAVIAGAGQLLEAVRRRGFQLVVASSGKPEHVERYLDLLDARDLLAAWTTSDDVEDTKPAPDLLAVAMHKVHADGAISVGDSTWDFVSGAKLGVPGIAVRTGGFSVEELHEAGALAVYDSLPELTAALSDTPLRAAT